MTPRPAVATALLFAFLLPRAAFAQVAPIAAPPPPPVCPANALLPARVPTGEQLTFKLDVLGVELGTFEMTVARAPSADRSLGATLVQARGKTSDVVSSNARRVDGWSSALITADGEPVRYREEFDEGNTHRSQEVQFPARSGALDVRATRNGDPDPVALAATPGARDLLSSLFVLRRQKLLPGGQLCAEIYGARRMWRVDGKVAERPELVETLLGKVEAIRIDAVATRLDDPRVTRKAHVWITTDARRLPVVILGDIRGRYVRAQLAQATPGHKRIASASR